MNRSLHAAKSAKNDEFYTRYEDIKREVEAYLEHDKDTFRGKVVYCNCDDAFESNFFRYFAINFNRLGLKKLISSGYALSSSPPVSVMIDRVKDDSIKDVTNSAGVDRFLRHNGATRVILKGDGEYAGGDFRSSECVKFLEEADIVVTNPPFSLSREYISHLILYKKKFLIIGNINAVTYKEVFPLIKRNLIWMGCTIRSGALEFGVPDHRRYARVNGVRWFTNIEHGRRPQKLPLITMAENLKFSRHNIIRGKADYDRYDNYAAIEVPFFDAIPSDYAGVMGVPVGFVDKYNPSQFEIVGATGCRDEEFAGGLWLRGPAQAMIAGRQLYKRIFIRHRRAQRVVQEDMIRPATKGTTAPPWHLALSDSEDDSIQI